MHYGSNASWDHRDRHLFETLQLLLGYHGANARGGIWEHNSHLGDAAATEMGDYAVYLRAVARVLSTAPRQRLIVLGDFDRTIPRKRALQEMYDLITQALDDLHVATAGAIDGLAAPLIDHVCHTRDLNCSELRLIANEHAAGRPLSDHVGTLVRLMSNQTRPCS